MLIPQRLLGEALMLSANKHPLKTAIIVKGEQYSYATLSYAANKMASHFISSGIKKGDRLAIYLDNSWECIVSIYGASIAGAVFLVINPQTKIEKLQYILNDCNAKLLVAGSNVSIEFLQAIEEVSSISHLILCDKNNESFLSLSYQITQFEECISANIWPIVIPNIIPNDLAALIYTSGSTGFPKGVMMTHQSMVFTSWSLIQYLRLTEDDRIMLLLPLAFDYGLYQLLMSITIGGTLIVEQSFVFPATVYRNIEKYQPTVFPGVPTIYAMMIAANKKTGLKFDCIKKITNTAASLPAEFIPDLQKIFPEALIFKMYGLTECKRVCYLEPELIDLKPNSVGKAIPGTEVFLLSLEGDLVANGAPGILHIRGPHVMAGYWNKESLSNEMLKNGPIPGEHILCSNDWFRMDEEGFLYFLGRNDDIIKTRGEKVSPVEIENVIYRLDGIKEVAALGVPDHIMGESIVVFVTTHEFAELNEKAIIKECMHYLEQFMIPQKVVFLSEMPKSTNGKIDKKELVLSF